MLAKVAAITNAEGRPYGRPSAFLSVKQVISAE